jgi:hypothetical protein
MIASCIEDPAKGVLARMGAIFRHKDMLFNDFQLTIA